ncbi:MAG TPA: tryptophanase [Candidatus Acidoferrales bacterium]|nr:tryptophanase [Candidatus Acidoferrales bacterium]
MTKTIIEPFKIKSVEPINFTTRGYREKILREAYYNLFSVKAEDVLIDLLTDSGTAAMSSKQWAAIMDGDESYAGSRSFYKFEEAVKGLTGFKHIIPTHQGRAAEKILFTVVGGKGKIIPNNTHFDTTRANVEFSGAEAIDLPLPIALETDKYADFKGDIELNRLEHLIKKAGASDIPICMLTLTNNSVGGQPVSMKNIKETKALLQKYDIPLFLDACRFAENAYFIKLREQGYKDKSVREIAQEMFSHADGCTMSAKKDALVNIGGFLALNDEKVAEKARSLLIMTEGFPTYGGLAGRDLDAMAQGLMEVLDEDYLKYRIRSIEYFGEQLRNENVPIIIPTGGHAVFIDAKKFVPHIPPHEYPGQAIAAELYLEGGIRSVEIGSVMFGKTIDGKFIPSNLELVRLAIPRRVYTQSHIDYASEIIIDLFKRRNTMPGYSITYEPPYLRHFTAHFKPNAPKQ